MVVNNDFTEVLKHKNNIDKYSTLTCKRDRKYMLLFLENRVYIIYILENKHAAYINFNSLWTYHI